MGSFCRCGLFPVSGGRISQAAHRLLSKEFDVSINTLLGSPRQLICQCCGMPLEDENISKEIDGFFNEEYCKWCYADGEYMYHDMDDLIEVCVAHMKSEV